MAENKPRSEAQKAADARYTAKNPNRYKVLAFKFATEEADRIEAAIAATGLSKVDFLRRAAEILGAPDFGSK